MEGERTVSVMITTEKNRDEMLEQIKKKEERQVGKYSKFLPLGFSFWGVKVYTLQESAFEDFRLDDGEPCNCLILHGSRLSELMPYWENLQAGKLKLKDVPIVWKVPKMPVFDYLINKEKLPLTPAGLKDFRIPKYLPIEPIPPPDNDHLKRLVSRPGMSREEIEHMTAHRMVQGGKLCIVLLNMALKKLAEDRSCTYVSRNNLRPEMPRTGGVR